MTDLERSALEREIASWKAAAEGWQAQTDREVEWRERLRAENQKLRWALEEACSDAWTDGESAAQQYMRRAESRPESDEEVGSDG